MPSPTPSPAAGGPKILVSRSPLRWITAVLFFSLAFWMTRHAGWTAEDVFWAFWVTSLLSTALILGGSLVLYPFFPQAFTAQNKAGEPLSGGRKLGVFIVFFLICATAFLWIHYMAALLAEAFAAQPQQRFSFRSIVHMACMYWPIVLPGFFLRLEDFFHIFLCFMAGRDSGDPEENVLFSLLGLPVGGLGVMWTAVVVLVCATLFAEIVGMHKAEWIFVLVYTILYLPVRLHVVAGVQARKEG